MNKIAFYASDITNLAGTERATLAIANGLARSGDFKVFVISTKGNKETVSFDIDPLVNLYCLEIDKPKRSYFSLIKKLHSFLIKEDIFYLVSVETMSVIFTLPVFLLMKLRRQAPRYIIWEHFNFRVNLGKSLRDYCRRLGTKFADGIVVLTEKDKNIWFENLKITGRIEAINNPSPFPIFKNQYNENSKCIIAIGRLTLQKGFDILVDIWKAYYDTYLDIKDWKVLIIGDGPDKTMINDKIVQYNLTNSIELISNTSQIAEYYKNASFLVMTSRFEGLPMTLIEAQSFGLPIIAYDCITGPSEVISINSGFLIENNDSNSFIKHLNLLIKDSELRKNMSLAADKEAQRFKLEIIVEKWKDLLIKLA